jgi:UDP-glucuronate decarboxylase
VTGPEPSQGWFSPEAPDDPIRRRPDISKAKRLLNWEPKIPLEKALEKRLNTSGAVELRLSLS